MGKRPLVIACVFGIVAFGGNGTFAQRTGDDRDNRLHSGIAKARSLIGGDIESPRGEDVGDIEDIVCDAARTSIAFVVVSLEGRGTDSSQYTLLPWSAVTPKPGKEDKLIVNFDPDSLRNAPAFNKKNWPDLSASRWRTDVDNFFGSRGRTPRDAGYRDDSDYRPQGDNRNDSSKNNYDSNRGDRDRDDLGNGYRRDDQASRTNTLNMLRLSQVVGADVENTAREGLGDIHDIVIDPQTGKVPYAVLSFGGFLGMGDKWFAVPLDALTFVPRESGKTVKIDRAVLNMDKQRLKNAPGFDKDHWPVMADTRFASDIAAFYGATPTRDRNGRAGSQWENDSDQRTAIRDSVGHKAMRASQLMRLTVKDTAGKNVGDVEDLVVDPSTGRVSFVVLSMGGVLGVGEKLVAIPCRAINVGPDQKTAYLNVDEEKLRRAPTFDKSNWPDVSDTRWWSETSSYFGMESD
ncbi:MAG: PRC-barrel domain-containing protein [Planctomycetes bacterium]|nr:PRC-barrel domain-containing protein [Planctomycetota bacterium]MBI3844857.1 PRC-barrel domain-containing protein [Planctomycetota bacterium]